MSRDASAMSTDPLGILEEKRIAFNPTKYGAKKVEITRKDTSTKIVTPDFFSENYEEGCSEKIALERFKSHMKFYYPDWKIYGKPIIKRSNECIYEVQFQTIDPHEEYLRDKEVVIVRVNLKPPYFKYGTTTFETIRGDLY